MSLGALGKAARGGGKWLQGRFNAQQASLESGIKWIDKGGFLTHRLQAISEMIYDENQPESVDAYLGLQAQTFEAGLIWLAAKDDPRTFNKIKAYLRNYTLFTRMKSRLEYNKRMRRLVLEEIAYYPDSFGGRVSEKLSERFEAVLSAEENRDAMAALDEAVDPLDDGSDEMYEAEPDTTFNGPPINPYEEEDMRYARINFLVEQLPTDIQKKINRYTVDSLELTVQFCRKDLLRYSKLLTAMSFGTKDVEPAPPIAIVKPESPPPRVAMPTSIRDSRPMMEMQRNLQQLEYYMQKQQQAQIQEED